MKRYFYRGVNSNACICCGEDVLPGDLVYNTEEGVLHDECFYDFMRTYVKGLGWKRVITGGGDM